MKTHLIALAFLFLSMGCHAEMSEVSEVTIQLPSQIDARLQAAFALENGTRRQNAVGKCAQDAAKAGEVDVVLKAIAAVDSSTVSDNLCAICSQSLTERGDILEAIAVAKKIQNSTQRENALSRIAWDGEEQ